ncbi:MAG: hypothetical protein FWG83_00105 [Oscillospiraceae bacterium]|nr:hypothetical protein [Oscillospiraceae bacterium]
MSTNDKRELLKLKQGLITEEETTLELEKTLIIKPRGWAAVMNFAYHNKFYLWVVGFFMIVTTFFVYFALTSEKYDITILLIADEEKSSDFFFGEQRALKQSIDRFVPDFNGDGKQSAACLFIDLVKEGRRHDIIHGNSVKLFGEVQSGNALIFIGNKDALEMIPLSADIEVEDFYVNLAQFSPNADGFFFPVKGSVPGDGDYFEYVDVPEDLYIALRKGKNAKRPENESEALTVIENLLNGILVS